MSFYILIAIGWKGCVYTMKKEDSIIYACVVIGAGIGLVFGRAIIGVLIGLGIGYIIKTIISHDGK
ncbi:hypothetical protein GCM10007425_25100 [Lysinibacillus alkalisoli]|uniref:Uncharacterized protein n=1 Tax=Lysinibacillus alkalisoli TaxID=1911548 RepID=A0A917G8Y8_9BACI|nr:hypothetical protein GCM10007425_25100 [Lysinibacillus alkalisoli]